MYGVLVVATLAKDLDVGGNGEQEDAQNQGDADRVAKVTIGPDRLHRDPTTKHTIAFTR
jgi:hypothetical protein